MLKAKIFILNNGLLHLGLDSREIMKLKLKFKHDVFRTILQKFWLVCFFCESTSRPKQTNFLTLNFPPLRLFYLNCTNCF